MKIKDNRIPALIRFAMAITVLNLAGHLFLGFEQSFVHMLVAMGTAYTLEILFETLSAKIEQRASAYVGGFKKVIVFLLPCHISALAVSMLLFTNVQLMPIVFGTAVAVLSKVIFKVNINGRMRHFLNPSNTGIAMCFLLFPWVGTAPPYQFSENVTGAGDWILIAIFVLLGSFLNARFTKKIPLINAWLIGFFLQAIIRTSIFSTATIAALVPMTGVAFLLFTFYMISDPSTTPMKTKNQIMFGAGVALVYGCLMSLHMVFGLFFSLLIVCTLRGSYFWVTNIIAKEKPVSNLTIKEFIEPVSA